MIQGAWGMKKAGGWTNPYVTDGLCAMWDGEWNAGPGVHDANATTWKNLVEGSVFGDGVRLGSGLTTNPPSWGDKSCYSPEVGSWKRCFNVAATFGQVMQIACCETVARMMDETTTNYMWNLSCLVGLGMRFYLNSTNCIGPAGCFEHSDTNFQVWNCTPTSADRELSPTTVRSYHVGRNPSNANQLSFGYNGGTPYACAKGNGMTAPFWSYYPLVVGSSARVELFTVRYYSRALTASERAANYAVDAQRFNLNGGGRKCVVIAIILRLRSSRSWQPSRRTRLWKEAA